MSNKREKQIKDLDKMIGISRDIVDTTADVGDILPKKSEGEDITDLIEIDVSGKDISLSDKDQLNKDLIADYASTRQLLKTLISKGQLALTGILVVAADAEHPRAYEVAGTLIKTLADVSNNLLELQKSVRELSEQGTGEGPRGEQTPQSSKPGDQQMMMVGTFNDMLDLMDKAEEQRNIKKSVVNDS